MTYETKERALEFAIKFGLAPDAKSVVDAAKAFEAYLRGEDQPDPAASPAADPEQAPRDKCIMTVGDLEDLQTVAVGLAGVTPGPSGFVSMKNINTRDAITDETEFAGYGFTGQPASDVSLPENWNVPVPDGVVRYFGVGARGAMTAYEPRDRVELDLRDPPPTAAEDISEAVRAIADEPPEAPDTSDSPEMDDEAVEAVEGALFEREDVS